MVAKLINGKEVAQTVRNELKQEVIRLKEQGIVPGLTVVLVGNNPASETYVRGRYAHPKKWESVPTWCA